MQAFNCPFCGSAVIVSSNLDATKWHIECEDEECMASGPIGPSSKEATEKWNSVAKKFVQVSR